jgi:hypothetical protein
MLFRLTGLRGGGSGGGTGSGKAGRATTWPRRSASPRWASAGGSLVPAAAVRTPPGPTPVPDPPPTPAAAQQGRVPECLGHGAEAHGFRGGVRTRARIPEVLEGALGARHPKGPAGQPLRAWHWAPRVLVSEGDSGFDRRPGLVRTSAPGAHPPVVREEPTRDHRSVMGGRTPDGGADTVARQESLGGSPAVELLAPLRRVVGSRLLVGRGGSPIHRRAAVAGFASGTRGGVFVAGRPFEPTSKQTRLYDKYGKRLDESYPGRPAGGRP